MNSSIYLKESARTASTQFHQQIVSPAMLEATLEEAIKAGHFVDAIKKSLFYGKALDSGHPAQEIKSESAAANPDRIEKDILHAVLGLYTEAAEMLEGVLDAMRGKEYDSVNALEECGDAEWYLAMLYRAIDRTPEEAKAANIEKLRARYPDKFETAQAIDRKLSSERQILEKHAKTENTKVKEQSSGQGGRIAASLFKAYDIRGVVGEALTPEAVHHIGRAIGSEAHAQGQQSIIVGRDGRISGPELVQALIEGLRATGRDVVDIGVVPTPLLYFATQSIGTGSGVMLTGSHNPPNYNGMKIMLSNDTLALDAIQALRRRVEARDYTYGAGNLQALDVVPDYVERVTGDVRLARPLRVVVDCGNGAAGEVAPRLFRALGSEVLELYCEIDGHFPHHHPDPSQLENLEDLINKVKEEGADLGLAFDGDGDRLGVIDSRGHIIWPDRQLMLYAADVLSRHPQATILYDVKCSRHLDQVITEHGGNPMMWKTGHSLMKARMRETGALLAGEMSGHIFFKERWFGFDDALYAGARLLEILSKGIRTSEEIFASLPEAVSTPELRVEMVEGEHFQFMEELLSQAVFEDATVTTIDGLRVDFADGWGLVRPSNTTPCLVLRFEADNVKALARIKEIFRHIMLEINPGLSLPF